MKKLVSALMAVLIIFSLTACSGNQASTASKFDISLDALMNKVYEGGPEIEISLGPTTAIDLSNSDSVRYYTGLSSSEGLSEAVYSEAMINSIAYSVCLAKVKDDADINSLKKSMFDGVNARKWLCVAAEKVYAVDAGGVILLILSDEATADGLYSSFKTVAGGNTGELLKRSGE